MQKNQGYYPNLNKELLSRLLHPLARSQVQSAAYISHGLDIPRSSCASPPSTQDPAFFGQQDTYGMVPVRHPRENVLVMFALE